MWLGPIVRLPPLVEWALLAVLILCEGIRLGARCVLRAGRALDRAIRWLGMRVLSSLGLVAIAFITMMFAEMCSH